MMFKVKSLVALAETSETKNYFKLQSHRDPHFKIYIYPRIRISILVVKIPK